MYVPDKPDNNRRNRMETTVIDQPTQSTTDQPTPVGSLHDAQILINDLTQEIADLRERHTRLQAARDRLADDVAHDSNYITERLTSEAERRGWCEQYDEIIESLNSNLRVVRIEPRTQEFDIEVTVTATVSTTTTVTVTATRLDDAVEMIQNGSADIEDQAARALEDHIANSGWDDIDIEIY
jgi:hypothetical protein